MRTYIACCLIAAFASGSDTNGRANGGASVIQKVIEMLQDNKMKVQDDLTKEEAEMAEYSKYCDDEISAREYAIKTASRTMTDLQATIIDAKAQSAAAADEISTLGTEIAAKDGEIGAATTQRMKEKADFEVTEKELVGAVDQLEKAVVLLKRGAAAFLQSSGSPSGSANWRKLQAKALSKLLGKVIDAAWVDHGSSKVLKGFLQEQDSASDASSDLSLHRVADHESSTDGIVETVEEMKEKAQETLSGVRMTEMKAEHNFQMLTQSLQDARNLASERLSDAKSLSATLAEDSGKAKGEMAATQKTKFADAAFLASLQQECEAAAAAWADKEKTGKDEMAAIEKAKGILAERVKVFFVQTGKDDPQSDVDDEKTAVARNKLVSMLKNLGHKVNSFAMMELAASAAADPFEKIRGLISDMIAKLVSEANAEASQKQFCDEEKTKSTAAQSEKSMRSDELKSRLETAGSTKASLEEGIKELQSEVAEIDKGTAEATKIRAEERASYVKASADFKEGAKAVEEAIGVLKEFYASTGALLQVKVSKQAPTFAAAKSDAASTIISILENSGAEFTKMYMQIETSETEAVAAFAKMQDENKLAKATKLAEIKGMESEIKSLEVALQNGGEDLKMVTKELDAVMTYLEKLKPQCETKAMTYAEKKAKREAEIDGLKEALAILDAPALLQKKASLRGIMVH